MSTPTSIPAAPAKKMIHLIFFDSVCAGNHMNAGQWKRPGDQTINKDKLEYWLWMAKLAEKGKLSAIFLADAYGGHETYKGSMDTVLRGGTQAGYLDPFMVVSAMAAVTSSVGIAITGSTSYIPPYINARAFSSLDHLSNGRVGWNIVTSWSQSSAQAFGQKNIIAHDDRYKMADEYMDLMYSLWNGGWADDAKAWDVANNTAYDPEKIKRFDFEGKHFAFTGRAQTHPSPQRTPFLFQAGTSKSGMAFAAKHAEGIYTGGLLPGGSAAGIAAIRALALAAGRDPSSIQAFIGMTPILGRTLEEAQEKERIALQYADPIAGLAQFCGYSGLDLSVFPLDEPFDVTKLEESGNAVHTIIRAFNEGDTSGLPWTPRRVGLKQSLGGFHPMPVGTASMVADLMEEWINIADVDGFNVAPISNPGSFEDIVELLVPELQRRGLMHTEFPVPGGTLRETMTRKPGRKHLADDHYGASFAWERNVGRGVVSDGEPRKSKSSEISTSEALPPKVE